MSGFTFKKAARSETKLRAALDGPSGSGKTYTALRLAFGLVAAGLGSRVAVIDTEHGSASKYADESPDGTPWAFDSLDLEEFNPNTYVAAMHAAYEAGYDVVVLDSLSHAWMGTGGALDLVDKKGGRFDAWKDVTPLHRNLIEAIVRAPFHVIGTMRTKADYVIEDEVNRQGRTVKTPKKIGTAPVQREGLEYEFDVYASLDLSHQLTISKSRCSAMDGKGDVKPGPQFWRPLFGWLKGDGTAPKSQPAFAPAPAPNGKPGGHPATNGRSDQLPASGEELHRRLREYDAKLASQRACGVGALLSYVSHAGAKAGYGEDISRWAGPAIPFGVECVKAFERDLRPGGQHEAPRPAENWTLPTLAVKVGCKAAPATGADLGRGVGWVAVQLGKLLPNFDPADLDEAIGNEIIAPEGWQYDTLTPDQAKAGWEACKRYVAAAAKPVEVAGVPQG